MHKTYLEEKIYKIMIFIWNNRPIITTRSIQLTSWVRLLDFHVVALQKRGIYLMSLVWSTTI